MATQTSSPRTCVARKKRLPMKVSKGLEFPVVALPCAGHMPAKGEDQQEAARVFYVAATRATQRLVMGGGWGWRVWGEAGDMQGQQALVNASRWDSLFSFLPNKDTVVVENCDHLKITSNNASSDFEK
jgi:superfamily I DNA/RNA helicase